jgi:hypothetical protein
MTPPVWPLYRNRRVQCGIEMASYLTELPAKEVLRKKLRAVADLLRGRFGLRDAELSRLTDNASPAKTEYSTHNNPPRNRVPVTIARESGRPEGA